MKFVLIFLISFFTICSNAQTDEGVIRYLITHNWTKKMAAVDYISKQQKERQAYMWGNRSEWKSYCNMYFNASETKYEESEERAEPDDEGYSWKRDMYFVKRNFANRTILEGLEMSGKKYIIEDTLKYQDWKILNDMKEVAGHICMNASWEDTLKKQKIVAWFALDIPMQGGPERLCGLPGMILEATYNDGAMTVSADKIDLKKLTTELAPPKKLKGKKVTDAGYLAVLKEYIEEKRKEEQPYFWGIRY
jgi:GLPGLI family protein